MSTEDLQLRARQLETTNRRASLIVALLMFSAATGYVWLFYLFAGMAQRTGATLTLVGYSYCLYEAYRSRAVRRARFAGARETSAAYRTQLECKREFCTTALRRFMLPLVPGPAILLISLIAPELGIATAVILTTMLILSPFALAVPLLRREASVIDRELASLHSLGQ